jgi:predicted DCC family thiol-disulfide oxidoreductase YuxK
MIELGSATGARCRGCELGGVAGHRALIATAFRGAVEGFGIDGGEGARQIGADANKTLVFMMTTIGKPGEPGETGGPAVVLYDGECGLCDRLVQFILPRDRAGRYFFAALQSDWARAQLQRHGRAKDDLDTMVLLQDGTIYVRSTAALRVLRGLPRWRWTGGLLMIPARWRDAVYRFIARNRHRWFNRPPACGLPAADERGRFLG